MRRPRTFLNTILGVVIAAVRARGAWVLIGLMLVGACREAQGPTEPAVQFSWGDDWLKQLEESEKQRIAAAQEASKTTYDALKVVWQQFLDTKPDQHASPLLVCDPLQYTGQVKIIGRQGGDIDFGPHKLRIPRGALRQPTVITAEMLTALHVQVRFSPHGLVFLKRPTLLLSYKHCYTPSDFHLRSVVYIDENGNIIEEPPSRDYPSFKEVVAWIWHFSQYAVAF